MNIALFGKSITQNDAVYIQGLIEKLETGGSNIFIYEPFYRGVRDLLSFSVPPVIFTRQDEIRGTIDILFSLGGDGTLLDTVTLIGDTGIPIIGINMGRLGFLSSISKEEIMPALDEIISKKYIIDSRTLLRLETSTGLFGENNYAMNDLTVYKKIPHSMLTIKTFIDDDYLNTYWADGLIVATPTGSTAYSMSCTGPIITPHSENFVITPIASHNLTVRPIVIPDKSVIRIRVEGRTMDCSVGLDSRTENLGSTPELVIRKEKFEVKLVQISNKNFFKTIREKLKWGLDIRN
jgi:NAD+ kinase